MARENPYEKRENFEKKSKRRKKNREPLGNPAYQLGRKGEKTVW